MSTLLRVMVFGSWLGALEEVSETKDARQKLREFLKKSAPALHGRIEEICFKPKARWTRAKSWDVLVNPLLGLEGEDEDVRRTRSSLQLPGSTRDALDRMETEHLKDVAAAWKQYLSFQRDGHPAPLGHAIFRSIKVPDKQYDIIIWAHSDAKGGTELACTVAIALQSRAPELAIAVATPVPEYVLARYAPEGLSRDVIVTPTLMHPKKRPDGGVDPVGTYEAFKSLFLKYPLEAIYEALAEPLKAVVKPKKTLFISCGEPLAMAVAGSYGCTSIMVTDHLITLTISNILESGGYLYKDVATALHNISTLHRRAAVTYLPPEEFASPGCLDYLSTLGVSPMPLRGLFYEAPTQEELQTSFENQQLAENLKDGIPLVCIFGGGGETWSETLNVIDDLCRQGEPRTFSLLLQSDPSSFQASWHLFAPDARNPIALRAPKRMLHWYALADLVVGRGGLVAQQVLACVHGATTRAPRLLFVEDPGHPLIENERRRLHQIQLVNTVKLTPFRDRPLMEIQRALDWLKAFGTAYVRSVRLRYGAPVLPDLADVIVREYLPASVTAQLETRPILASSNGKGFSGVKILVTGSRGFIGRSLVAELRRQNAQVVEHDLKTGHDVLNRRQLQELSARADITFHLAGASSVTHFDHDPERSWRTTTEGLANVLDICGGRIVFPSTASIYGDSCGPASETSIVPPPVNEYARAKQQCEQRCRYASKDVRVVRIFSGYGPGDDSKGNAASPLAKFLRAAEAGGRPEVYGDGQQARDFIFVDDIVAALIALATSRNDCRHVHNVGTGKATTFLDLIKLIKAAARLNSFDHLMTPGPPGYPKLVFADTTRAERELGFRASVSLEDGLRRTIQADFPRLVAGWI